MMRNPNRYDEPIKGTKTERFIVRVPLGTHILQRGCLEPRRPHRRWRKVNEPIARTVTTLRPVCGRNNSHLKRTPTRRLRFILNGSSNYRCKAQYSYDRKLKTLDEVMAEDNLAIDVFVLPGQLTHRL